MNGPRITRIVIDEAAEITPELWERLGATLRRFGHTGLTLMSEGEAWIRDPSESSESRAAFTPRRERADVQDDGQERLPRKQRQRQRVQSGELEADGSPDAAGHSEPAGAGVRAGIPAGARVRQHVEPVVGAGEELAPDKYPVNFSTGPTVEVDGTEVKITP